jgi:hypothetical protein
MAMDIRLDIRIVVLDFATNTEIAAAVAAIADDDLLPVLFEPLTEFLFRNDVNPNVCAPHLAALFCSLYSRGAIWGGRLLAAMSAGMMPMRSLLLTMRMTQHGGFQFREKMADLMNAVTAGDIIPTYDALSGKVTYSLV